MSLVTDGWDGLWASLAGGLLSGATVVGGVYLAQHLVDARRQAQEKRAEADALLVAVGNTRDAAVNSRSQARSGGYDLWPLRHQIFVSHSLRGLPVLKAVQNFYQAVWELRNWVRHGPVAQGDRPPGDPRDERTFAEFTRAIDDWADGLIEALTNVRVPLDDLILQGPRRPPLD